MTEPTTEEIFRAIIKSVTDSGVDTKGFSFLISISDFIKFNIKEVDGFKIVPKLHIEKGKVYFGKHTPREI